MVLAILSGHGVSTTGVELSLDESTELSREESGMLDSSILDVTVLEVSFVDDSFALEVPVVDERVGLISIGASEDELIDDEIGPEHPTRPKIANNVKTACFFISIKPPNILARDFIILGCFLFVL
jgi:hypothetical protein